MTTTTTTPDITTLEVLGAPSHLRRAGTGRPLVVLHGAFSPTAWLPFHDELARHAEVIAPILPGYLEGEPPEWLRGFDDLVLHLRGLLDQLDLGAVDLVGHDLGGWLAATFAAYYPERVRTLSVLAPTGLRLPDHPPMEWLAADPARVVDALFNGEPGEHAGMFPPPSDIDGFVRTYGENGVTARLIWERRYDVRLERRLRHLAVATHVITPIDDRVVPPAHAERWAELVPGARLTRVADVGHALHIQDPVGVASIVSQEVTP